MKQLKNIEFLISVDTNNTTDYEVIKLNPNEEISDAIVKLVKKIKEKFPHDYKEAVKKLKNIKTENTLPDQVAYYESKEFMRNWLK